MIRLPARWVFPGDGPPLEHAVLEIDQGRIQQVRTASVAEAAEGRDVAVVPGLVNAHTHLEFSDLARPIEPLNDFPRWIRAVIAHRRQQGTDVINSVQAGIAESLAAGVTGLGEIATSDWLINLAGHLTETHWPQLLVFREILGLREELIDDNLAAARRFLEQARRISGVQVGLSPHAPYSLHPRLFAELCQLAEREQAPAAMHLAESPAELELLARGTGPLMEMLQRMGLWKSGALPLQTRPRDYLVPLAALPRALVIHGTYLDSDEIDFLAAHPQMSVVFCPRTHAAMQTGVHPWQAMLQAGVNVALGTDSRASSPDLSLWNELRFLKSQQPRVPATQLLALASVNGARALGWPDRGRLAPGQDADLCVVTLSPPAISNPQDGLFSGTMTAVMKSGHWTRAIDFAAVDRAVAEGHRP